MPLYLVFSLFDSSNCPGYKKAGKATFIPNRVYALTRFMDSSLSLFFLHSQFTLSFLVWVLLKA
jgi:hypothetical protein